MYGAGENRIEYRLYVRLRAADDTQDVAGRRLRVERRGQLAVARLQLREQPHILNGDDGLVGEGPEQSDLVVREPAGLATGHRDRPDGPVVAEHWHRSPASVATETSVGARGFWPSGIAVGVGDVDWPPLANRQGIPRGHLVPLARLR